MLLLDLKGLWKEKERDKKQQHPGGAPLTSGCGAVLNLEGLSVPFVTSQHVLAQAFRKADGAREGWIFLISGEFTEQLEVFISVKKNSFAVKCVSYGQCQKWPSHWESWRGRCRGGREPRGTLLALASARGSGCQRLLKLTGSHRQEKKNLPYLALYLSFLLNAPLATSRWPLGKPRGPTPVCGSTDRKRVSGKQSWVQPPDSQVMNTQGEGDSWCVKLLRKDP